MLPTGRMGYVLLNLVIEHNEGLKRNTWVVPFKVSETVDDPEKALRDAVHDFVHSDKEVAKVALRSATGYFNWGEVMSSVPSEYFEKHGLTPLEGETFDVVVDHDEVLDDRSDYQVSTDYDL